MKIYIDDREKASRIDNCLSFFLSEGFKLNESIRVVQLKYGDYIFRDNGINVIFEYKTVDDFISSLGDFRVFNQALNQSNNYDYHFVIIVGSEKERKQVLKKKARFSGKYVTDKQYYGAISSLVNFTSVIQVPNEDLSFEVMKQIADHCCDKKPLIKRYRKSRGSPALKLLVSSVNGVGLKRAERICNTLKLYSIKDVVSLNEEKLTKVDGIGKKGAKDLLEQIKGEYGSIQKK